MKHNLLNLTTNSGTGETLTIKGQGVTGTGTTTSGAITLSTGSNTGSTTGNVGDLTLLTPAAVGSGTIGKIIIQSNGVNCAAFTTAAGSSSVFSLGLTGTTTIGTDTFTTTFAGANNISIRPISNAETINFNGTRTLIVAPAVQFDLGATAPSIIQNSNVTASATAQPFVIQAQGVSGSGTVTGGLLTISGGDATGSGNGTGGNLVLRGGDKSNTAFGGAVQIRFGSLASTTMVEVNTSFADGPVVALCRQAALTTTMMPAGTGSSVIFIANTSTPPTVNSVSGGIFWVQGGGLYFRGTTGTVTKLAND